MLKKLKEKKAYTLVEIVAVIVILGLLLLIAVPAVNKQLTNFRINYYKKLEQSVASAAKDFISDNSRKKPTKVFHSRVIKVSELEKDGYIDEVKDYIGKSCDNSDNSYSYVLVVKTGVKEYDYTTCLKCSQDEYATDTTGTKNNYCDIAWMTNEYIEYSMDEKYQKPLYIYYGTDQGSIIEQSKIYYDIIKENNDGSILATKVMDRADDTIVPSNVEELFNKELNTTINLKYILSDGEVLTRNGIIYKHNKPTVEMYYGNDNIYNGKTKNENYSNGEWANKLVVKFSFSDEDNTVTNDIDLKSIEYYDKESKNWQDTNCTLSEDKKSCTLEINNDLNSDMAFRVVNEYGYKGDASDYYTIQVDATKPGCELKASGTLGDDGWYISDVTLNFNQKTDDLSSIGNFDLTDSLTPTFNNRDEIVINIESGTKTYYGHVIDKAGNTNVCSKNINKKKEEKYAIYFDEDKSLRFIASFDDIKADNYYNGKKVTAVYTGFENRDYTKMQPPWSNYAQQIEQVIVETNIKPISLANWFAGFYNCSSFNVSKIDTSIVTSMKNLFMRAGSYNTSKFTIEGLENWDTSQVKIMENMFYETGKISQDWDIGELSRWNTSNVTNMHAMFSGTGQQAKTFSLGNLEKWDVSKVTDFSWMFSSSGSDATEWSIGDLSNWQPISALTMEDMFYTAGYSANTFNIGSLENWNVSSVNNMRGLFHNMGYSARTFNIGDLSNWDTSKVTDMAYMFHSTGNNTNDFSIGDLSNWDTSKVTDMAYMFRSTGYNTNDFSIGSLENWNVSNVTDFSWMFAYSGQKASKWSIGDLSKWEPISAITMKDMFYESGYNANTVDIGNLGNWNVSSVENMRGVFHNMGYSATKFNIGDLSKWNTSNVTDMGYLFCNTGHNASNFKLDLSGWNVEKVSEYRDFNSGVETKVTSPTSWAN